jgi:hypothetical protein
MRAIPGDKMVTASRERHAAREPNDVAARSGAGSGDASAVTCVVRDAGLINAGRGRSCSRVVSKTFDCITRLA